MTSKNAHIKAIGVCLKKETDARAAIFDATQHKHDETLGTIIHRAQQLSSTPTSTPARHV